MNFWYFCFLIKNNLSLAWKVEFTNFFIAIRCTGVLYIFFYIVVFFVLIYAGTVPWQSFQFFRPVKIIILAYETEWLPDFIPSCVVSETSVIDHSIINPCNYISNDNYNINSFKSIYGHPDIHPIHYRFIIQVRTMSQKQSYHCYTNYTQGHHLPEKNSFLICTPLGMLRFLPHKSHGIQRI